MLKFSNFYSLEVAYLNWSKRLGIAYFYEYGLLNAPVVRQSMFLERCMYSHAKSKLVAFMWLQTFEYTLNGHSVTQSTSFYGTNRCPFIKSKKCESKILAKSNFKLYTIIIVYCKCSIDCCFGNIIRTNKYL